MDPRIIDDIAQKLSDSVPQGLRSLEQDVRENFKGILKAGLTRLDLVTREEFDVQAAVLRRTREKLEALEKQIAELEEKAGNRSGA
ncbi:MAG: accessory factor UbiK family protein [Gammaproteobacteria bacterium]